MNVITSYIDRLKLARRRVYKNVEMFPLLAASPDEPCHLTLSEALDGGRFRVHEGNSGLSILNAGQQPVLVVAGEVLNGEVKGGVATESFLAPPKAELLVPETLFEPEDGQQAVHKPPVKDGGLFVDAPVDWPAGFNRRCQPMECQVGAVFVVNGEITGMEAFAHPAKWAGHCSRIVTRFSAKSIEDTEGRQYKTRPTLVRRFLHDIGRAKHEKRSTPGDGHGCNIEGSLHSGMALCRGKHLLYILMHKNTMAALSRTTGKEDNLEFV